MNYNIEVYSGVLVSSEICRAYVDPDVEKFMDDEKISQDKQSMIKDKIYEMVDMIIFEYHKKVKSIIQSVINNKVEDLVECSVNIVGSSYYDIYMTLSKELDKEDLAYHCLDMISQETDEAEESLLDEIKLAVNSIIEDELSKDFTIGIKLVDITRGMEVIEVH